MSSTTEADQAPSLYAPLLHEVQQALDAVSAHHNHILTCQAIRSQQADSDAILWKERFDKIFESYLPGNRHLHVPDATRLVDSHPLSMLVSADVELSVLNDQLRTNLEQRLNHKMGLAARQLEISHRLVQNVTRLMEQLRADEQQAREHEREQAGQVGQFEAQQKEEFVRAWIQNNGVVDEGSVVSEGTNEGGYEGTYYNEGEGEDEADETFSWQS